MIGLYSFQTGVAFIRSQVAKVVDGNRLVRQCNLFSSVQDGIYALGKAHMHRTPSLRSFPNIAFKTVPMLVWLTMALSRPLKEDRLALPLSTPLSSRRSMVWCSCFTCNRSVSHRKRSNTRQSIRLLAILCTLSCLEHTHSVLHLFFPGIYIYIYMLVFTRKILEIVG